MSESYTKKVEDLYLSWKERVGQDRANVMLGAFAVCMSLANHGVDDDLLGDAFEEVLTQLLGISTHDAGESNGNITIH